jgi:hypothetical protein
MKVYFSVLALKYVYCEAPQLILLLLSIGTFSFKELNTVTILRKIVDALKGKNLDFGGFFVPYKISFQIFNFSSAWKTENGLITHVLAFDERFGVSSISF